MLAGETTLADSPGYSKYLVGYEDSYMGAKASLQEESNSQNYLKQALNWLDQTHSNWRYTICSEFGQAETILNIANDGNTIRLDKKELKHDELRSKKGHENETFLVEFLKLKLGGILICDYEAKSFRKVMQLSSVDGFERYSPEEENFKCDFIFIHHKIGIHIIETNAFSNDQIPPEEFIIINERLRYKIRELGKLHQLLSKKSNFPIHGIIYIPGTDEELRKDISSKRSYPLVDKSLIYDENRFREFWNNRAANTPSKLGISILFIAALFTYCLTNPIFMSSNALEIYRRFNQDENAKDIEMVGSHAQKGALAKRIKDRSSSKMRNKAPLTNILSQTKEMPDTEGLRVYGSKIPQSIFEPDAEIFSKTEHVPRAKKVAKADATSTMIANQEQLRAIKSEAKRIFINGPPGTGKTHCLFLRALNAAKKEGNGRVIMSTPSAPELIPKLQKFYSKNKGGLKKEIEIDSDSDKPICDRNYSPKDDLFFDESVAWDSYGNEKKSVADFIYLCQQPTTTGSITIVGWIPTHIMEEAKIIFSDFEFHHLTIIMRGTENIVNEWKDFFSDINIRIGHNFKGTPIDRCRAVSEQNMFTILEVKVRSLLTPLETMTKERKQHIGGDQLLPADVAIIISSTVRESAKVHDSDRVSCIREYLNEHLREQYFSFGTIREQIANPTLIAVSNAEDALSYDWPIVIMIVYTDGNQEYKKTPSYVLGVSRAIAELVVVECITGQQKDSELEKKYRKAAEQGDAEAQFTLGLIFSIGQGVSHSDEEAIKWYKKAAKQGHAEAQTDLGNIYYNGQGKAQDRHKAVKWYKKAAKQGEVRAQHTLGNLYYTGQGVSQCFEEAAKWYAKAAEQSYAPAQNTLGFMYDNKQGVPQSEEEAVKWYRKAAEQGHATAQYNLGCMYQDGAGVPQSYQEAAKWYQKSAEGGKAASQFRLGSMFSNGCGALQSNEEAAIWFRKAAEKGHMNAQFCLGLILHKGRGIPQSDVEAIKWYNKAAVQGHEGAMYCLGLMHYKGRGVPQSDEEAVKWLRRAAEQDDIRAFSLLGSMYFKGRGVIQSNEEAVKWLRKAAEQDEARAQCNLGFMYYKGRGVSKSHEIAMKWYRHAAEQGQPNAQFSVGIMYNTGHGISQSYEEAVKWYIKAAEQDHADAQFYLALCYDEGQGIDQSYEEAVKWYTKAAEQGHCQAQFNLGIMYANGQGVDQSYEEAVKWYTNAAEQGFTRAQVNLGICYQHGQGVDQLHEEAIKWWEKAAAQGDVRADFNIIHLYIKEQGIEQSDEEAMKWYKMAVEHGHVFVQCSLKLLHKRKQEKTEVSDEGNVLCERDSTEDNQNATSKAIGDRTVLTTDLQVKEFIILLEGLRDAVFVPHTEALKTALRAEEFLSYAVELSDLKQKPVFEKEREKIGPLLAKALPAIRYSIHRTVSRFESEMADIAFISRKGLQFLFDNFSAFPAAENLNCSLKEKFELFKKTALIEKLDEYLGTAQSLS